MKTGSSLVSDIEKIASRLGIERNTLYKVYCRDEDVPSTTLEKLLKFENELSKMGEDIDSMMREFCEKLSTSEEEKLEAETVIRIPVYVQGEERNINIVIRGGKAIIESNIENVCREPSDIVLGETSLYLKCSSGWIALLHGLRGEQKNKILRILSRRI